MYTYFCPFIFYCNFNTRICQQSLEFYLIFKELGKLYPYCVPEYLIFPILVTFKFTKFMCKHIMHPSNYAQICPLYFPSIMLGCICLPSIVDPTIQYTSSLKRQTFSLNFNHLIEIDRLWVRLSRHSSSPLLRVMQLPGTVVLFEETTPVYVWVNPIATPLPNTTESIAK